MRSTALLLLASMACVAQQPTAKVTIFREDQTILINSWNYKTGDFAPAGSRWNFYMDGMRLAMLTKNRFATFIIPAGHHQFKFDGTEIVEIDVAPDAHLFMRPRPSVQGHRMVGTTVLDSLTCEDAEHRGRKTKPVDPRALYSGTVVRENGFPVCLQ